jgi:heme exporter protein C
MYLWKREERWDLLAGAAAEVAAVLTALTIALGSIWGRPTWGVWWTWDPRLTSTAILLVIIVGYLALRSFVEEPERRARWSAAVGILGALNVPIVYMSVRWWRTLHQPQSSPSTVDPAYAWGLRLNAIAFLLVMIWLVRARYRAARLERIGELAAEREALGGGVVNG